MSSEKRITMLNIGIIGNTEVLEPHVKRIQKNKDVNVIGKASVGTSAQLNGFHFSIPELNRVELIERADILLVDNSSRLPFKLLFDMVRKSKHIFITQYLSLTPDECSQLVKLANESGSIIQVTNPFFYSYAIQWLNSNINSPIFLNISKYTVNLPLREALFQLLFMVAGVTGISPKKVSVSAFKSEKEEIDFANIRLDFSNASVVNINFGSNLTEDEFEIKGYAKTQNILFDFKNNTFIFNSNPINFPDKQPVNEFYLFVESIQNKNQNSSNIEDYLSATQLLEIVEKKFAQFID
jgi:hypothetical protein